MPAPHFLDRGILEAFHCIDSAPISRIATMFPFHRRRSQKNRRVERRARSSELSNLSVRVSITVALRAASVWMSSTWVLSEASVEQSFSIFVSLEMMLSKVFSCWESAVRIDFISFSIVSWEERMASSVDLMSEESSAEDERVVGPGFTSTSPHNSSSFKVTAEQQYAISATQPGLGSTSKAT